MNFCNLVINKQIFVLQDLKIIAAFFIIYAIIIALKKYILPDNLPIYKNIFFYIDLFILIPFLFIAVKELSYKNINLLCLFLLMNIFLLSYLFLRGRLPGKAWELVLVNKHKRNLDTFMVVLSLIFATSFGAITTFKIEAEYFNNPYTLFFTFFLFISTNIVIMTILVVLSTYVINTMGNRKPIMMFLVVIIGLGLLTYEGLNFNKTYRDYNNLKVNHVQQQIKK